MNRIFLWFGLLGSCLVATMAHDVVWPENPNGFNPSAPMRLTYPGGSAVVRVKPVTGELCTVVVNVFNTSLLVKAEIITENPAQEVDIRITVLQAPKNGAETNSLGGEWHATGSPDPKDCTATSPNSFLIPVAVTGSDPEPEVTISDFSPRSATSGQQVTITGKGFDAVTRVSFGGVAGVFNIVDDRTIIVTVPTNPGNGPIVLTTSTDTFETDTPFVPQPTMLVQLGADGKVSVVWSDRQYPFTLQSAGSLSNPVWNDIITTFDNRVMLPVGGGATFYRLAWQEIPFDTTDYLRDRADVARFYYMDIVNYWATYGVPALARLSMIKLKLQTDPITPFEGFMQGFNEGRFLNALTNQQLPIQFATLSSNFMGSGSSTTNAFINTFITLVGQSDLLTNCPDTYRTNCMRTNVFVPGFKQVITNTMTTNSWTAWAPYTNKTYFNPAQITNAPPIKWVDVHGSDNFTTNSRPSLPPNDDTNTTFKISWANITSPSLWNTTYDAACVAVAVGSSLAKLGVVPPETTCRFWNELSKLVGATPGTLGAHEDDIAAFYKSLGYGCSAAYDGPIESAVEEAKKALQRGCDVQIEYINAENTKAHEEVVLDITIDPNNSSKATISTLSWSTNATVTYTGSSAGGSYTGKSDGRRYRKTGETASYLEGTGTSILRYYCKE